MKNNILFCLLIILFLGFLYLRKSNEAFTLNPAQLNYKMGNYSNILLMDNNNNYYLKKNVNTIFGTPTPLTDKKSIEPTYSNGTTVDGTKNTPKSLAILKYNYCNPGCCPSTYSCSNGCVCLTDKQSDFINKRGNNRTKYSLF